MPCSLLWDAARLANVSRTHQDLPLPTDDSYHPSDGCLADTKSDRSMNSSNPHVKPPTCTQRSEDTGGEATERGFPVCCLHNRIRWYLGRFYFILSSLCLLAAVVYHPGTFQGTVRFFCPSLSITSRHRLPGNSPRRCRRTLETA